MNTTRPRPKRSLTFESLEGRLVLSSAPSLSLHHPVAPVVSSASTKIPITFKLQTPAIDGSMQLTSNVAAKVRKDRFSGQASGTLSGTTLQGGLVNLSNANGSLQLSLSPISLTKVGKHSTQKVQLVVAEATGAYAKLLGNRGLLTVSNVPAHVQANYTFSGYLKPA